MQQEQTVKKTNQTNEEKTKQMTENRFYNLFHFFFRYYPIRIIENKNAETNFWIKLLDRFGNHCWINNNIDPITK